MHYVDAARNFFEQGLHWVQTQNWSDQQVAFLIAIVVGVTIVTCYTLKLVFLILTAPFRSYQVAARRRYSDEVMDELAKFRSALSEGAERVVRRGIEELALKQIEGAPETRSSRAVDIGLSEYVATFLCNLPDDVTEVLDERLRVLVVARAQSMITDGIATINDAADSGIAAIVTEMLQTEDDEERVLNDDLRDEILEPFIKRRVAELLADPESELAQKVVNEIVANLDDLVEGIMEDDPHNECLCDELRKQIEAHAEKLLVADLANPESEVSKALSKALVDWLENNSEEFLNDHSTELGEAFVKSVDGYLANPDLDPTLRKKLLDGIVGIVAERLE